MRKLGVPLLLLALSGCSAMSTEQLLRPDQTTQTDSAPQKKRWQPLVVIDNPYTISSDRLEKMNKGGFGGY